jgi:hypothetical protein
MNDKKPDDASTDPIDPGYGADGQTDAEPTDDADIDPVDASTEADVTDGREQKLPPV